jgi:hypothetical protein
MLVEFASAVDAVRNALEIQRSVTKWNTAVPQDQRIEFRVGIHVGDVSFDDDDIFGYGVDGALAVSIYRIRIVATRPPCAHGSGHNDGDRSNRRDAVRVGARNMSYIRRGWCGSPYNDVE